jgi:VIT1/CCC1 family predicted Fe2+/Mn2+ transporter
MAVHEEQHRQIAEGWARATIFGISDGLVTNVSLILGVAGASASHHAVRLAGLAGLLAGAFSMGSGEYISMRSQRELFEREIAIERRSLQESPAEERQELVDLFIARGIDGAMAGRLADELMKDPDLALATHAREELGIDPSAIGSPWKATLGSAVSFAGGAFIPLVPWLFTSQGNVWIWSVGLGALTAIVTGGTVGRMTGRGVVWSAARQLVVAAAAAGITAGLGRLIGG